MLSHLCRIFAVKAIKELASYTVEMILCHS